MAVKSGRTIQTASEKTWKSMFLRWETMLVLIFITVNIMNISISPNYLSVAGIFGAIQQFLDKAFLVLPMIYILILGEIDISVAAIVTLSSCIMGIAYNSGNGLPMEAAMFICLFMGSICGLINGLLLIWFPELPSMIVTLATQIAFRGTAELLLGDKAAGGFSSVVWFSNLAWSGIGPVPWILIIFIICAIVFGILLSKTTFGRRMYAIGSNVTAAKYAGIHVKKIKLLVFTLTGLMCGVCGIFMMAKMGSARSNIAEGYELEAISMCVLGGVSTAGGKGNLPGVVIAVFIIGMLRYGLGLINVTSQIMLVIIGSLLVIAVMLPNVIRKLKRKYKSSGHCV